MEATRKRKALNAPETPSSDQASASKKIKLLNSKNAPPAKSNVQELGKKLLNQLRDAKDKAKGHYIADQFLVLPPRDELPDYYQITKLPIAFDTIEAKLQRNAYPSMTALESDLRRMVQNAKEYNAPKSDIYEDAERIRKLVFNYMKQHNPEYASNPNYTSFPTPIPQTNGGAVQNGHDPDDEEDELQSDPTPMVIERPRASAAPTAKASVPPSDRKGSMAPSATTGADDEDGGYTGGGEALDFTGVSFQEAQQKIISYLLHYTDEEGLEIYQPFGNLPTRKLEDYYQLIKHPVSLKGTAKRARGHHGRNPPTGVSDFKTWDAFEEEISFIWRNAQEYNDDASDMFALANEFKDHFKSLLAEAREKVDEPAGPRIKLGGPKPKVMLNLSQQRDSPAPAGVHVDNDALARQRQMVAAGANGNYGKPASMSNGLTRPTSELRPQSGGLAGSPPGMAIKNERFPGQTPILGNALPAAPTNGMMPPPSMRPPSGSPYPSQPVVSSYTYTAPGLLPPIATRTYPLEQALLPAVTLATHPQLPIPKRFSIAIPPHDTLAQQSTTLTLPNTHYFLQICPTISRELSTGRPYKLFVTLNGVRLNQRDTKLYAETGRRTHVYEGSLMQGVNRVEVEVAAQRVGGSGKEAEGLDVEKVTVYANLMRA